MKIPKAKKLPSGMWFCYLRLGGESYPITTQTEKECIRQAQLIKAEYLAGKKRQKADGVSLTVSQAIDAYIDKRDAILSPSTIQGYRVIQRNRFKAVMDRRLSDIRNAEWQTVCNNEARICSAKTLKNSWGLISSVIADATGQLPPKIRLPQVIPAERPFLEPEQIAPFVAAVHETNVEIPALLALSSLRRSEIFALTWERVDLKKRIIHVSGAAVMGAENNLIYKPENKTATSTRIVPIMIPELYEALKVQKKSRGYVVTCPPNAIYKRVNKICEQNDLPLVGVHGLRHSFASLAYHLGVPEKIAMQIGGWSNYQTMRKIYTHIARSDVARYADEISAFFQKK